MKKSKYCRAALFLLCLALQSCGKFLEVPPPKDRLVADGVYTQDPTAIAAVTQIYKQLAQYAPFESGLGGISTIAALTADEMSIPATGDVNPQRIFRNELDAANGPVFTWAEMSSMLYAANLAMEGLAASTALTPQVKKQLLGEAKFIRAWGLFYFVNLYGEAPLLVSSDYRVNAVIKRSPIDEVYNQIVNDLLEAKTLLSNNYLDATLVRVTTERVRPTKWAATALLARTYLYMGSRGYSDAWPKAEAEATEVINQSALYDLPSTSLNNVFLKNSAEAIWQWQPITGNRNTDDGFALNITAAGLDRNTPAELFAPLLNSFEAGDPRKLNWVNSITIPVGGVATTYYYPYKYKVGAVVPSISSANQFTEYTMVMRLAEQYLIRAEARAQQNNNTGAVADLNVIRKRARGNTPGILPDLSGTLTKVAVLDAIMQERRVELFVEWGHRWFDLKRIGKLNEVMTAVAPLKGSTWKTEQALYPVPFGEIQLNPNLVQNPGYQ